MSTIKKRGGYLTTQKIFDPIIFNVEMSARNKKMLHHSS